MAGKARDLKAFTQEESWLRESFGEVRSVIVVAPNGEAEYTAQMPRIYDVEVRRTDDNRTMTTLLPLEGRGNDWKGTYAALFAQVCDLKLNYEFQGMPTRVLYRHRPRDGQDPGVIHAGGEYEQIGMYNAKHDHDDPNLADMEMIFVDALGREIDDPGFDVLHTHLYAEQPHSTRS